MKLLFTDLDGTLLNDDKTISPKLRTGIIQMLSEGNRLILSSGRSTASILPVKEQLGIPDEGVYVGSYNCAHLLDCRAKEVLLESPVPFSLIRSIADAAAKFNLHIHTYSKTHIVSEHDTKELTFYRSFIHTPYAVVNDFSEYLTEAPFKMIAINLEDTSLLLRFGEYLNENFGDSIQAFLSCPMYLEIINKKAGKGYAVDFLSKHLSVPISDTIAVGDAQNDISMIKAAGIGVAMKNGEDELKAYASYITEHTCSEDGVLEVIEKFILNT